MKLKLVYVAGPFRAPDQWQQFQNIRRAETLAFEVWKLGAVAICPHLNTAHFQDALPDKVWLDGDLEIVRRCDAVIMVEGWENSKGARKEKELAHKLDLPVFIPRDGCADNPELYEDSLIHDSWFDDWIKL